MKVLLSLLVFCSSLTLAEPVPPSPFEQSAQHALPSSQEISAYLTVLDELSPQARLVELGRSAGGRPIEALLVSDSNDFLTGFSPQQGKPTVLLLGSQHGNEPSSAEAIQLLARQLVAGEHGELLDKLNLVLVAMANPDGRDLSSRYNASMDNTNIDYVALNAGETRLLVDALHRFDPDVVYDAHESGIWKRILTKEQGYLTDVDAQFDMGNNPNIDGELLCYTEQYLLPALLERVSASGLPAVRYRGEITDLKQSVARGGLGITNLRNYAAMQGRISILVENRLDNKQGRYDSPRNIAERVRKQLISMEQMLGLIADEADRVTRLSRQARQQWNSSAEDGRTLWMAVSFEVNMHEPVVSLPLVRMEDGKRKMYSFPNHDAIATDEPVRLAEAYAITREQARMADWLRRHHIEFEVLEAPRRVTMEQLVIERLVVQPKARPGVREKLQAVVQATPISAELSAGDLLVPTDQPMGPLAALMLDPRSANSLYQESEWNWLAEGEFPVFPVITP
ncbi:M14 family zinc carboxypeptidase [Zobellella maritima]|uniref:M14 family zinc carboxypeptidase n=1 Tax=Zobellella maritima TaxID=2059725 RepID=UPI000E3029CA|nr:M14 family zinc carboxypeptidase [Zobellella maritima]